MKVYQNRAPAPYGVYYSARPFDLRHVGEDGEPLFGLDGVAYRRVPTPALLALAPALGGLFFLVLPLVIFAGVGACGWQALLGRPGQATLVAPEAAVAHLAREVAEEPPELDEEMFEELREVA